MIEKRRRDKINNSLMELRRLVPAAFEKQGSAKLEKAEILQMTVDYLKMLHARGLADSLTSTKQLYPLPQQQTQQQVNVSPSAVSLSHQATAIKEDSVQSTMLQQQQVSSSNGHYSSQSHGANQSQQQQQHQHQLHATSSMYASVASTPVTSATPTHQLTQMVNVGQQPHQQHHHQLAAGHGHQLQTLDSNHHANLASLAVAAAVATSSPVSFTSPTNSSASSLHTSSATPSSIQHAHHLYNQHAHHHHHHPMSAYHHHLANNPAFGSEITGMMSQHHHHVAAAAAATYHY